jgi:hypothetical protein
LNIFTEREKAVERAKIRTFSGDERNKLFSFPASQDQFKG